MSGRSIFVEEGRPLAECRGAPHALLPRPGDAWPLWAGLLCRAGRPVVARVTPAGNVYLGFFDQPPITLLSASTPSKALPRHPTWAAASAANTTVPGAWRRGGKRLQADYPAMIWGADNRYEIDRQGAAPRQRRVAGQGALCAASPKPGLTCIPPPCTTDTMRPGRQWVICRPAAPARWWGPAPSSRLVCGWGYSAGRLQGWADVVIA